MDMCVGAKRGGGLDGRWLIDVEGVDHIDYDSKVSVVQAAASVEDLHHFRKAVGAVQTTL